MAEPRDNVFPDPPIVNCPVPELDSVTFPVRIKLLSIVLPVPPLIPSEVPAAIVITPVPRASAAPTSIIPEVIVTPPENDVELFRSSVSVPAPDFSKVPVPESVPEKVTDPVSATVSVWPEAMETVPPVVPPPWMEPMVSLEATCKMALATLARLTAPVFERALPPLRVMLPAEIVVRPV